MFFTKFFLKSFLYDLFVINMLSYAAMAFLLWEPRVGNWGEYAPLCIRIFEIGVIIVTTYRVIEDTKMRYWETFEEYMDREIEKAGNDYAWEDERIKYRLIKEHALNNCLFKKLPYNL